MVPNNNLNSTQAEGDVREQVKDIFDRDWNSPYAFELQNVLNCDEKLGCEKVI